jgi:hypothetical protein
MTSSATMDGATLVRPLSRLNDRIAGLAGLGFAAIIVVQNVVRSIGAPANDAPAATVIRYISESSVALSIVLGLFVPAIVLLVLFASGLLARAARLGVEGPWNTIGFIGLIMICGLFAASNAVEATLVAMAPNLADTPTTVDLLWRLHTALFVLNLIGIGLALIGLSRVSLALGLIPTSVGWLAVAGSAVLLVMAIPVVAMVAGSALFYLGLIGFLPWIVWVAAAGLGLAKATEPG